MVAAGSQEEGGGGEQEVKAYVCDGRTINEWFTGTANGNELDHSSEDGSRLEDNLTPDISTGTNTLADGRSFLFVAKLASGVAGL